MPQLILIDFFCFYFCICFQSDPAHLYGFVYFRQVKDPSIQRGYFQKVEPSNKISVSDVPAVIDWFL